MTFSLHRGGLVKSSQITHAQSSNICLFLQFALIYAVPMSVCLGKHLCMSLWGHITHGHTEWDFFFPIVQLHAHISVYWVKVEILMHWYTCSFRLSSQSMICKITFIRTPFYHSCFTPFHTHASFHTFFCCFVLYWMLLTFLWGEMVFALAKASPVEKYTKIIM